MTVLWSDSKTKECLTPYVEGLACKTFDQKDRHHVRRFGPNTWYVLLKLDRSELWSNMTSPLKFEQVCVVNIDHEKIMSCSCGYLQQMLMPCRHIAAVLSAKEVYLPSMFHIH